jgi:hypothetical protein
MVGELNDTITKFRDIRRAMDDKKRLFILASGEVTYLNLRRG